MLKVNNPKIGKNYLLNFCGVQVVGELKHKSDKMTLMFKVICPFESNEKTLSFLHSDILGESEQTYLEHAINQLNTKLIYAKDFSPHKVGYYEQRVKEVQAMQAV